MYCRACLLLLACLFAGCGPRPENNIYFEGEACKDRTWSGVTGFGENRHERQVAGKLYAAYGNAVSVMTPEGKVSFQRNTLDVASLAWLEKAESPKRAYQKVRQEKAEAREAKENREAYENWGSK
jgi:hypothetical protein